jgi:hypothetical protein
MPVCETRAVIPEAGFLFSIAGLSASFAGLAGLVMAFRRGGDVRPIDTFRLRQMVEFSFANIIIAVSVLPLSVLLGTEGAAARWVAGAIALYAIATNVVFARRTRRAGLRWRGWWAISALGVTFASLVVAAITIMTGNFGAFEALLVLILVRPMLPFLLVLNSWESENRVPTV